MVQSKSVNSTHLLLIWASTIAHPYLAAPHSMQIPTVQASLWDAFVWFG